MRGAATLSATRKPKRGEFDNSTWGTPRAFFAALCAVFRFTLDVAASKVNAKLPRFVTEQQNALGLSWRGERWWCNPPYGDGILSWLVHGREELLYGGALGGMFLIPSRVDTRWWRAGVLQQGVADVGRLVRSSWVPSSGMLWIRYQRMTVGVYHHTQRLLFEGGPRDDSAPFPASLVIFARPRDRIVASSRAIELLAAQNLPNLTEGWPR